MPERAGSSPRVSHRDHSFVVKGRPGGRIRQTNSAPAAVQQQLANAGLTSLFERSFSVDTVRRFKPAPEAYRSVAETLKVPIGQLRLVAAHAWDVVGALRAGCAAAFVARPGKVLYPLGPTPDIVGPDFRQVAQQIVAAESA
jgi:2-haloacid dehalogenase